MLLIGGYRGVSGGLGEDVEVEIGGGRRLVGIRTCFGVAGKGVFLAVFDYYLALGV